MDWQEFKDQCMEEQIVSTEEKLFTGYHLINKLPLVCEIGCWGSHYMFLIHTVLFPYAIFLFQGELSDLELQRKFGKSSKLKESGAQILSASSLSKGPLSSFVEAAHHVAGCDYEHGTCWGTEVPQLFPTTFYLNITKINIMLKKIHVK